jgi:small subunit ribosomal protein S14
MVNFVGKDKKRRKLFLKKFKKRTYLKKKLKDKTISFEERYLAQMQLTKMNRNSSKVRIKNRCILTGRSHSVLRLFKISRIKIRELVSMGLIPGLKKASW